MFTISFILSVSTLVLFCLLTIRQSLAYRGSRIMTPSRMLAIGVFFSSWFLLFPYYYVSIFNNLPFWARAWESLLVSLHHVIRFFVVDTDFSDIQNAGILAGTVFYSVQGTILMLLAPILTFSVILSFWKNLSAYRRFWMHPFAATYVFSELNEKSITLATDIKANDKKAIIIFTDVFEDNNEECFDLIERAREIGAICFKKDMLAINLRFHSSQSPLYFFAIAEAQNTRVSSNSITPDEENLKQARQIVSDSFYKNRPNTYLFVFSASAQGELLFDNLPESQITVRRVKRFSNLIMRLLYNEGKEMLFDTALEGDSGEKEINAVIVGAGGIGEEMIKSLVWYCQMDGYRLNIDVFDISPHAQDYFAYQCPAMLNQDHNGNFASNDMPRYKIQFHCGMDVKTKSFIDSVMSLPTPTYVFVALGSDERNVGTAIALRREFDRLSLPQDIRIDAVVYYSENKKIIEEATKKGEPYRIHCIGDLSDTYSQSTIIKEDFEQKIKMINREFYKGTAAVHCEDDYGLRSSEARVVHNELQKKLGIWQNACQESSAEDLRLAQNRLEHRRWIAYMFAQGYTPAQKSGHDPIAKTHHLLVPFEKLPPERQKHL